MVIFVIWSCIFENVFYLVMKFNLMFWGFCIVVVKKVLVVSCFIEVLSFKLRI